MEGKETSNIEESTPLVGLPADRMLIEPSYALTELMALESRLMAAQAGLDVGAKHNSTPFVRHVSPQGMQAGQNGRQSRFAHIKLEGMMTSRSSWYSSGVGPVIDALNEAYEDKTVQGVLLEINTGGGEVTAGQMLASAVKDRPKPLLAYGHMVASGGIMAAMNADEIMASSPLAQFGSIGVMRTIPTWMVRYYANYYTDIYSDLSKNKNRPSREFAKNGSMQAWVEELNELAEAFQDEVKAARTLRGDVNHTLSGEMFRANEAKNRGLIDSIGSYADAINRLFTLSRADRI